MNWKQITQPEELDEIVSKSFKVPQVIFKHSTRCSISSMAKGRLERTAFPPHVDFHFLDLIRHRNISNKIESIFNVAHESPQVLMIRNGKCVYDESHSGIHMNDIVEQAEK